MKKRDITPLKNKAIRGAAMGVAVGLLVGLFSGGSNLLLLGAGPATVVGPLVAFVVVFTLYGLVAGAVVGVDAVQQPSTRQPAVERAEAQTATLRPATPDYQSLEGSSWMIIDGDAFTIKPGSTVVVLNGSTYAVEGSLHPAASASRAG
ncbi:MAG: hypothetical protein ACE5G8_07485 [Anaerolineae bacterium]